MCLTQEPAERLNLARASLDILLRTLASFALPDYLQGPRSDAVEKVLPGLERPTTGKWVETLRKIAQHLADRPEPEPFLSDLPSWYFDTDDRLTRAARILEDMPARRNEYAHGQALTGLALEEFLAEFEHQLRELLYSLRWLAGYRPFRVLSSVPTRDGHFRMSLGFLCGSEFLTEPVPARAAAPLLPNTVFLAHPEGDRLLDLTPFMVVANDRRLQRDGLFLVEKIPKMKKVRLVNDDTGEPLPMSVPIGDDRDLPFDHWIDRREEARFTWDNAGYARYFRCPLAALTADTERLFEGRFELHDLLGEGGMAHVWRARDLLEETERAVKVLKPHLAADPTIQERFRREGRAFGQISHPNVLHDVRLHLAGDDRPYMSMPLVTGGHLGERVRPGGQPSDRVATWARQILQALVALHAAGIVHRDIKPSNVLLDDRGKVLLADLGIALLSDDPRLTQTLEQLGSPAYMAPEQRTRARVTATADIYSLAVVLHELATGALPSHEPGHGIDGPLGEVICQMGAADSHERPDADEALSLLDRLDDSTISGSEDEEPPSTPPDTGSPPDTPLPDGATGPNEPPPPIGQDVPQGHPLLVGRVWIGVALAVLVALLVSPALLEIAHGPEGGAPPAPPPTPSVEGWIWVEGIPSGSASTPSEATARPGFLMMATEATVGHLRGWCDDTQRQAGWCGDPDALLWEQDADHPAVNVTYEEAVAFCGSVGGRLPTEEEWEWAARRGKDSFPWGLEEDWSTRANLCDRQCLHREDNRRDGDIDDGWPRTSPVAAHPAGASQDGVLGLYGNVFEMTSACSSSKENYHAGITEPCEDTQSSSHALVVIRGGAFRSILNAKKREHRWYLDRSAPSRADDTGFRCVASGEPVPTGQPTHMTKESTEQPQWVRIVGMTYRPGLTDADIEGYPPGEAYELRLKDGDESAGASSFHVPTFWMMKTEVTVEAYASWLRGREEWEDWHRKVDHRGDAYDAHPAEYVHWSLARDYCRDHGWRLPTEVEWEFAARASRPEGAPARRIFAWGDLWQPSFANTNHGRANTKAVEDRFRWTSPVDAHVPQGDTPTGLSDMSGNVVEWVADCSARGWDDVATWLPRQFGSDADCSKRRVKGGSYLMVPRAARTTHRRSHDPAEDQGRGHGFRCVTRIEPAIDAVPDSPPSAPTTSRALE